ncbi:unnamed protein product [Cuscuta campestris]|uniref:Uncharacterized protein n=1 Tax=Cuscuta campestris TaxID=132261 RepID=A0A484N3J8_9ASTE|nr:unnamed protein product [Cuscuta campestris]
MRRAIGIVFRGFHGSPLGNCHELMPDDFMTIEEGEIFAMAKALEKSKEMLKTHPASCTRNCYFYRIALTW